LCFVPGYAFARLWDTSWGNRATGMDSTINDSIEKTMKFRNGVFSLCMVCLNILLGWAFIRLFWLGYVAIITFMFIVFCPTIIQLICAFIFFYIVVPLRALFPDRERHRSEKTEENDNKAAALSSLGGNPPLSPKNLVKNAIANSPRHLSETYANPNERTSKRLSQSPQQQRNSVKKSLSKELQGDDHFDDGLDEISVAATDLTDRLSCV